MDWNRAARYCNWVGKRLPTAEEWAYAALGTEGNLYPWGNSTPSTQFCKIQWDSDREVYAHGTCVVGSFPSDTSPFGVLDMGGNVAEWTATKDCDSTDNGTGCKDQRVLCGYYYYSTGVEFYRPRGGCMPTPTIFTIGTGFRCVR